MDVIILDDEKETISNLVEIIKKFDSSCQIDIFNNSNSLFLALEKSKQAIVFLDIFIPYESGIELSKKINEMYSHVPIIFISGKPKETFDVYDGKHIYFLEKPFEEQKVFKALNLALEYQSKAFFTYSRFKRLFMIPINDIVYFESNGRIIQIFTTNNKEMDSFFSTLDDVQKDLGFPFLRANKSFLINPYYIAAIGGNKIFIKNISKNSSIAKEINITRNYKKEVMDYVLSHKHN